VTVAVGRRQPVRPAAARPAGGSPSGWGKCFMPAACPVVVRRPASGRAGPLCAAEEEQDQDDKENQQDDPAADVHVSKPPSCWMALQLPR
jgi:hypothetical protein